MVPHVSLASFATVFVYLFGVRLGTRMCDDLMLLLWPMPPSHFLCAALPVHLKSGEVKRDAGAEEHVPGCAGHNSSHARDA